MRRITLLGLLGTVVIGCGGSGGADKAAKTFPSAPEDRIVSVKVGGSPAAAAIGLGKVWVAGHRNGYVYEIDPRTAHVSHAIAVGGTSFVGLAVTENAVWVFRDDAHSLVKIDPNSRRVVAKKPLGEAVTALTPLAGALWGIAPESGSLVRIDPATMRIDERVRLPRAMSAGNGLELAEAEGILWLGGSGRIVAVDPGNARVVRQIRVAGQVRSLAVTPDAIYFVYPNATDLLRVRRDGGAIKRVAHATSQPGILKLIGHDLLLTDDGNPSLTSFDPGTGRRRTTIALRRGPPPGNTLAATDATGLTGLVSAGGALWLPDWAADKVYRVPLAKLAR